MTSSPRRKTGIRRSARQNRNDRPCLRRFSPPKLINVSILLQVRIAFNVCQSLVCQHALVCLRRYSHPSPVDRLAQSSKEPWVIAGNWMQGGQPVSHEGPCGAILPTCRIPSGLGALGVSAREWKKKLDDFAASSDNPSRQQCWPYERIWEGVSCLSRAYVLDAGLGCLPMRRKGSVRNVSSRAE
jgi:hypothetical protein